MVQDFAKIRPEPVLEKRAMDAPPAWTLLLTGLVTGMAVGVFGCFLLYLSGRVPPLQTQQQLARSIPEAAAPAPVAVQAQPAAVEAATETTAAPVADSGDQAPANDDGTPGLSFYQELPDYEVAVDATPVPLETAPPVQESAPAPVAVEIAVASPAPDTVTTGATNRLLQIGAFQQLSSAERQLNMLEELGVSASIRQASVNGGRVLHLVQAGPFASSAELNQTRSLLERNDISSFPLAAR